MGFQQYRRNIKRKFMINNKPNNPKKKDGTSKYRQGNFIPANSDKVLKLNSQGGIYYRSSWEYKVCMYLDTNEKILQWGCECIRIPYTKTSVKKAKDGIMDYKTTEHTYYPDFWYKRLRDDGSIQEVVMEVKPYSETVPPKSPATNATRKQLENFEYSMNMYNSNMYKWEHAIAFCESRDIKFTIMTEAYIKRLGN